jgi:hypothetical protein
VCFFAHSIQELRVPTCEKVINPTGITQETAQQLSTGDAALALQYAQATGLHDLTSQLLRSTNLTSQLAQVQATQFDPFRGGGGGGGGGHQQQQQQQQQGGGGSSEMALLSALHSLSAAQPQLQLPVSEQQLLSAAAAGGPGPSGPGGQLPSSMDLQSFLIQQQLQQLQQLQHHHAQQVQAQAQAQAQAQGDLSAQLSMMINRLDSTRLGGMDASGLMGMQAQQAQLLAAASAAMQMASGSSPGSSVADVPTPPIYESSQRNQAAAH